VFAEEAQRLEQFVLQSAGVKNEAVEAIGHEIEGEPRDL
jgi:hypothetical protein